MFIDQYNHTPIHCGMYLIELRNFKGVFEQVWTKRVLNELQEFSQPMGHIIILRVAQIDGMPERISVVWIFVYQMSDLSIPNSFYYSLNTW